MNIIQNSRYRFGFDFWGLLLFLLVMLPNFIWFSVHPFRRRPQKPPGGVVRHGVCGVPCDFRGGEFVVG